MKAEESVIVMEEAGVRSVVWYPVVLAAGLIGGLVCGEFTPLLFVLVGEKLSYVLSLGLTALVAALCAVFAGNALAGDGRRVRLWSVVGVGELAAALAVSANLVFENSGGLSWVGLGTTMTVSAAAIAVVCGVAAWLLRRPPVAPGAEAPRDAGSAAFLIALALVLLVSGVVIYDALNPVA